MEISAEELKERQDLLCQKYGSVKHMVGLFGLTESDKNDVVQEVMIAAYNGIEKLSNVKNIDGWLFRIVQRKAKHMLKKNNLKRRREIPYTEEEWKDKLVENVSFKAIYDNISEGFQDEGLLEYINNLKSPIREIIILRFGSGFKLKEIAQVLDLNYNTVKTIESRALKKIEKRILEERKKDEAGRTRRNIL